jgi:hypothetical protein
MVEDPRLLGHAGPPIAYAVRPAATEETYGLVAFRNRGTAYVRDSENTWISGSAT